MRDSVALYTAVYTPKAPGEAPVIIFRTPYGCGPYGAGRFPQGFAQIATLIAVSPASVSQQKFRLKKRMMQADGRLFADGETLEGVIGSC